MKVSVIDTGFFKLDGGAMFGVVPKQLWKKLNPPDENNMCTWAMRCLLVETDNRKIIIDTGFGLKQDAKFRSYFEPHGDENLSSSIAKQGLKLEDITDVFLTHLHFDHVGGALSMDANGNYFPTFPNATYWSNEKHFNWALKPNPREKASFLKENFVPLQDAKKLRFIDVEENVEFIKDFNVRFAYGHTEAMMIPHIKVNGKTLIYGADLMPSANHLGLPYVMSYDIRPLTTMKEKDALFERVLSDNSILFFEHDPVNQCASIKRNDRGRVVIDQIMSLEEAIG